VSKVTLMLDTSEEKQGRYHELLRAQPPHDRLAQAMRLSRSVRELALAGIVMRHPGASERETRVRLAVRLYGRELAQRVFGRLPSDAI
jgi:DNA-binding HxlR family transcriptional regulator